MWWTRNHNVTGHHIVTSFENPGGATNSLSLCHVTTVYGDWGIRDEITLRRTDWVMGQATGEGWESPPVELRTILGAVN